MTDGVDMDIGRSPGTYALVFTADTSAVVEIGRLGSLNVTPGHYLYIGSAFGPGGLAARVARHARRDKRAHWHIDYLRPYLELTAAWFTYDSTPRECAWTMPLS